MSGPRTASARRAVRGFGHRSVICAGDVELFAPFGRRRWQCSTGRNRLGGGAVDALLTARRIAARHQAAVGVVAEAQHMTAFAPYDARNIVATHAIDVDAHDAAAGPYRLGRGERMAH